MQPKTELKGRRVVWRVTKDAPQGTYVEVGKPEERTQVRFELPEPGWLESSFELTHGLEVHDDADSVPAELFDDLFKR